MFCLFCGQKKYFNKLIATIFIVVNLFINILTLQKHDIEFVFKGQYLFDHN